MDCRLPHFSLSPSFFKLMSIESTTHPTISFSVSPFSSCPQSFSASGSFPIRWPKYWSFSFSISPSNEYSGLISFRIDWFDLLAVQGTLKSLVQHHNSKTAFGCSAFFMGQLLYPYMTTGKNHSFDYIGLCQQSDISTF